MLVKIYGAADLAAAGILYFSDFGWLNWLKIVIILGLVFKGVPSVTA
ncbi:hypothetical protein HOD83_02315 [Candidatus Woesearchaeota archaeon]|jgi:hypothetical protein|nr:hypothetical protein [Candidatus Woesearchaeota archaeon]MBT4114157.1 hypothetical protein [Candidatus Woesearchaeota archaeon]MBT4248400.1 hypothetical protein [Candidatus Woesearchaeota archaeon]